MPMALPNKVNDYINTFAVCCLFHFGCEILCLIIDCVGGTIFD